MTPPAVPPPAQGRVLVVDDSPTMRQKLTVAASNLGCDVEAAPDGAEALARLTDRMAPAVDLVVLDIVMPGMDGFEVLRRMRDDAALREVPVLVVSSLEDGADVVRAIELGAADFLTKSFDRLIFRARLLACLERRRLRLRQLDDLAQIARLTRAARAVETHGADPARLDLGDMATRGDPIGDLARVFAHMVEAVHRRQATLERQVSLLKGAFLLLVFALSYGLVPPLSALLAERGADPMGSVAAVAVALAGLGVAAWVLRGGGPSPSVSRLPAALAVAVTGVVLPLGLILWAASRLAPEWIGILIAGEAVFVVLFAAATGSERLGLARAVGAGLTACAVALALLPVLRGAGGAEPVWLVVALAAVIVLAGRTVLVRAAGARPGDAPLIAACAAGIAGAAAFATGALPDGDMLLGPTGALLLALAGAWAVAMLALATAVRRMGAIAAGLYAAPLVLASTIWTTALTGTRLAPEFWLALAVMSFGAFLVRLEPRETGPMDRAPS